MPAIRAPHPRIGSPIAVIAAASVGFGLLIYALQPAALTPVWTDEVGFLKSAVETMQRGRPWTDVYLEPWAASLSVFAALLYRATGQMAVVLHGLVPACAVMTFAGLALLIRRRTNSTVASVIGAAVLLGCPVMLLRLSEFIGLVVFLPCLFWCVLAAETRRWGLFLVAWAVAVSSRQTALVWLIIPALASWGARKTSYGPDGWRRPALVVGLGLVWFGVVALEMNLNSVQLNHTLRPFSGLSHHDALLAGRSIAGFACLAIGCAGAMIAATRPSPPQLRRFGDWVKLGVALALIWIDPRSFVMPDPQYCFLQGALGWPYARIVAVVAVAGWVAARFRLRRDLALCVGAMIGVVALRAVVYDTYAIEVGALAFLAVSPETVPAGAERSVPGLRVLLRAAVVALAALSVPFTILVKARIDDTAAWTQLHVTALREGLLAPSELAKAPLPVRAWYLHDYAITHPLRGGRLVAAYLRFCDPTTFAWGAYPSRLAALEDFPTTPGRRGFHAIVAATFRIGWFWRVHYELERVAPATQPSPLEIDYRRVPALPVDESGWRQLIFGPRFAN